GVRVAFPSAVNDTVLQRFGAAPRRAGAAEADDAAVAWTQGVLRDYVLPELKPDVVINWLTEPDHIQHAIGAGSPQARASIRHDDAEVGLLLKRLDALGLAGATNIIVVSDHGFGHSAFGVNLSAELIKAGLKASPGSDDVVIASSGQTLLLHVKDRNPALIHRLTQFLQAQEWAGVLFTAGRAGDGAAAVEGIEPGTFALEREPALPRFDGRAIGEAFAEGPDEEQVPMRTTTYATATPDGAFRAAIQVSEVGAQRYIDKSWRLR